MEMERRNGSTGDQGRRGEGGGRGFVRASTLLLLLLYTRGAASVFPAGGDMGEGRGFRVGLATNTRRCRWLWLWLWLGSCASSHDARATRLSRGSARGLRSWASKGRLGPCLEPAQVKRMAPSRG
ncbi:unnamed protein product [Lampetra fluviatilis]